MTSANFKNPRLIINAASGSTRDISNEASSLIKTFLNCETACHYIQPTALDETIDACISSGCDLLVTYGGDGTSMAALNAANAKNIPVLPLPGGTMNVLPKSLYRLDEWQDVLSLALSKGKPTWIPCGKIGDQCFVVAAIFGAVVEIGEAREMLRDGDIIDAVKTTAQTLATALESDKIEYVQSQGGKKRQASLLQVTCPLMNNFANDPSRFEAAAISIDTLGEVSSLGLTAMFDQWRHHDTSCVWQNDKINIHGEGTLKALLDGEPVTFERPFQIKLHKKGALVLRPALSN